MIEGKKRAKQDNVTAFPDDRTYRQGFRSGKQEEERQENEYMSRQAEAALRKLRAMGE